MAKGEHWIYDEDDRDFTRFEKFTNRKTKKKTERSQEDEERARQRKIREQNISDDLFDIDEDDD